MVTLEENIKGLREFIKDEDVYQFYKGVIEEYSDEHARKALKNASDPYKISGIVDDVVEENQCLGSLDIAEAVSDFILSEDNIPKH